MPVEIKTFSDKKIALPKRSAIFLRDRYINYSITE